MVCQKGAGAMGEIKSTLDLVMERTRHLSLSTEEKEEQRREDFAKRLQGLLQPYADGVLSVEELRDRMAALQEETGITGQHPAVAAVLGRIDPDRNDDRWSALLEHLAPDICRPLDEILAAYRAKRAALLQTAQAQLQDRLARDHGITGSAVVPNPRRDPAIQKNLAALRDDTTDNITKLTQEMP
jgi:hypothetical protein